MMHVAFFLPNLSGGGVERVLTHLASELVRNDVSVSFVLSQATGPYLKELRSPAQVVDLACTTTVGSTPRLSLWLRKARPDVLVSGLEHACVVAEAAHRLAAVNTCLVLTHHNSLQSMPGSRQGAKERFVRALVGSAYRRAAAVVAISEGIKTLVLQRFRVPNERVYCIRNPVYDEQIKVLAGEEVQHPWFRSGAAPVVITAGRLAREKNHLGLIEAFSLLRKRIDSRLMILGEGECRPLLQKRIKELGLTADVALPGFSLNPFKYIGKSRLFVLPSFFEGLPTVLIEAMALGIPVVAFDCQTGPREILGGGLHGTLVPVGDTAALADGMERALDNPTQLVSPDALVQYTYGYAGQEYLRLFNKLKSNRGILQRH